MTTEALSVHRISTQLLNLGWIIDGSNRNVYLEGECATKEQKNKLEGKRPDYILYNSNSISPLAIIEAKRPGSNLENATEQGINYAKRIGAKIVFATDGIVTKTLSIFLKKPLTIDGEILRDFVNEKTLDKLVQNPNLTTDSKIIGNRNNLIKIFSKAEDFLRQDGIDAGIEAIYEFCSILFVKIKSEIDDDLDDRFHWDKLCDFKGNALLGHYKETIKYFKDKHQGIFRDVKIAEPKTLENIINSLRGLNLSDTSIDIKGGFLRAFSKKI